MCRIAGDGVGEFSERVLDLVDIRGKMVDVKEAGRKCLVIWKVFLHRPVTKFADLTQLGIYDYLRRGRDRRGSRQAWVTLHVTEQQYCLFFLEAWNRLRYGVVEKNGEEAVRRFIRDSDLNETVCSLACVADLNCY